MAQLSQRLKRSKYLSVYINSKTNSTDPSVALRNFLEALITLYQFWVMRDIKCWWYILLKHIVCRSCYMAVRPGLYKYKYKQIQNFRGALTELRK